MSMAAVQYCTGGTTVVGVCGPTAEILCDFYYLITSVLSMVLFYSYGPILFCSIYVVFVFWFIYFILFIYNFH